MLYRQADDKGRRLLNQAIFEQIYLFVDDVVDDWLKEPFRDLVEAGRRGDRVVGSAGRPSPVIVEHSGEKRRARPLRGGLS